jgi:monovalent cation:proton antiporter-2 (CPA2) family protein
MEEVRALIPAITLLATGIVASVVTRPVRFSPMVGYLFAGILIGPNAFGLVQESSTTHLLAELGVVFLLFEIGLHFSLARLWDTRRDLLGLGPLQVVLCTVGLAAAALTVGLEPRSAWLVGATLALSSTAVVVQTLSDQGQQSCPIGISATGILIFQDIVAIFLLILASSLEGVAASPGAAIGLAAGKAVIAFALTGLLGRYVARPLFRLLSMSRNEEIFTATALLLVLLGAGATGMLGLSLTLGAFLSGMVISETPYRHIIYTEAKPFRGLLVGFFFITVGMSLDPAILVSRWTQIAAVLSVLVGIKTLLVFVAALLSRKPLRSAVQLAFLLSQGSEFAFVIFGMPTFRQTFGPTISATLITAVAASLIITPFLAKLGYRLAARIAHQDYTTQCAQPGSPGPSAPLVIFGMNEVGRRVADALTAHGIQYTALEMDHDRFVRAEADGYPVAFGDAGDLRLMETIEMGRRPAVVVNIARYEVSRELTPILRERYPELMRFVSVDSDQEKARFEELGMRAVVQRSIPKGLDMAVAVLRQQRVSEEKIQSWMQAQQAQTLEAAPVQAGAAA